MSRRKKSDEPMIPCPSCKVMNRIASPFCKDCGDRIYKNGAAPTAEMLEGKKASRGAKSFRSAVNSLLFLAVVSVVALAFWPYASLSVPQANDPGHQVKRYLAIVNETIGSEKNLPVSKITQRNLNAYLGQNNDADTGKLLGVVLSAPALEMIANEPIGPFNLSTRMVVEPIEENGKPVVSAFWVGHLPLPVFWATPWTRSLSNRFDLEMDAALWNHLTIDRIEAGSVYVTYQP